MATDFVSLVSEIFQGYTELPFEGGSVFLRHINLQDQNYLESLVKKHAAQLVGKIPTEQERLEELKKEKVWTDDDDLQIREKEFEVKNLYQTKKKLIIHSQKKSLQDSIDKLENEILELKTKRIELISMTAEYFASRKANEEFLRHMLYRDESCSQEAFSIDEFACINRESLISLFNSYKSVMEKFSDDKIQEAVLQDFFSIYLPFCEKPWDFFGKPLIKLSVFQQKILVYGKMFLNIFQSTDKIPEDIRKDPKALLDFADSSKNKEKINKSAKKGEGSTSFVVGTRQDAELLAEDGAQVGDLAEELKNSGGFLSQDQLLKKLGISTV